MKRVESTREAVACLLHRWYTGYEFDECPNGPEYGLMKSARSAAPGIIAAARRKSK